MGTFVIVFALAMAGLGLLMRKYPHLISGYSTMPKEKLKNVDLQAVGNLFCKGFLVIGALMIALYAIFGWMLDMPVVAQVAWLAPIFVVTPVLVVMAQKHDKNRRSGFAKYWSAGLLVVILAGVVALFVAGTRPAEAVVEGDAVRFTGMYGVTVPMAEVARCELLETLPGIGVRTNGFALGGICKGFFRLDELGRCRLLIRRGEAPYLLIETKNGEKIVFSSPEEGLAEGLLRRGSGTRPEAAKPTNREGSR